MGYMLFLHTQNVCQNVEAIVHVTYHLVHASVILDTQERTVLKVCMDIHTH